MDRNGLELGGGIGSAICNAFAAILAAALYNPALSDEQLAAMHRLYQELCGSPPHTPLPGKPFDPVRGKPAVNPKWNCTSGGPRLDTSHPFQFPEFEPGDKIALGIGIAVLGAVVPPIIVGAGGGVSWPVLIPALGY